MTGQCRNPASMEFYFSLSLQRSIMGDAAYSFSLTTFSPSGKLLQIEYALNRVAEGKAALGISGKLLVLSYMSH